MHRNENKLEKARKEQEEIDRRLREAGMYELDLSPGMKAQMLQMLEESCESARLEEEERLNSIRWEQQILAQADSNSCATQQESDDRIISSSSGSSSRAVTGVAASPVTPSPAPHRQHQAKPSPPASRESVLPAGRPSSRESVLPAGPHHSGTQSSRRHLAARLAPEEEELVVLADEEESDIQVITTTTTTATVKDPPIAPSKTPQTVKRKSHDREVHITGRPYVNVPTPRQDNINPITYTPVQSQRFPVPISSTRGRSRTTSTTTITKITPVTRITSATTSTRPTNTTSTPATIPTTFTRPTRLTTSTRTTPVTTSTTSNRPTSTTTRPTTTKTNPATTSPVIVDDDSDPDTVPSSLPPSPSQPPRQPLSPRVLLVPLTHSPSPRKNAGPPTKKDTTPVKSVAPARKNPSLSNKETDSPRSSTLFENCLSQAIPSPHSSGSSTVSPDFIALSLPQDVASNTSSQQKLRPTNFSKSLTTSPVRRVLATSFVQDSSCTSNYTSPGSPSSQTSTTATTTTTSTTTAATPAPAVTTTTILTTSDEEPKVPGSPTDTLSDGEAENKVLLKTAILRSVNVFSRRQGREVPLRRRRPVPPGAYPTVCYRTLGESLHQCRGRIFDEFASTALCLEHHQACFPVLPWSKPLTVDCRLKDSLDRPRPASRQRGPMRGLEPQPRPTRQAARQPREAFKSGRGEGGASGARTQGLRRGKRSTLVQPGNLGNESDSDPEVGCVSPPLPSPPRFPILPVPKKSAGYSLGLKKKSKSVQARKTFRLATSDEGSDGDFLEDAEAARTDKFASSRVTPARRDVPDSLSELCIIDEDEEEAATTSHSLARPPLRRVARRGTRRPALEATGSAPAKLRKTTNTNTTQENRRAPSNPQRVSLLLPDCPDFTFEEASGSGERGGRRPSHEEEEETMVACPICQEFFPQKDIMEHASDCVDQQEKQMNPATRRQRRGTEEAAGEAATSSTSDRTHEGTRRMKCRVCDQTFTPKEFHVHIETCGNIEDEDFFSPQSPSSSSSSSVRQTNKRRGRVAGRPLSQEVSRSTRGEGSFKAGSLFANIHD